MGAHLRGSTNTPSELTIRKASAMTFMMGLFSTIAQSFALWSTQKRGSALTRKDVCSGWSAGSCPAPSSAGTVYRLSIRGADCDHPRLRSKGAAHERTEGNAVASIANCESEIGRNVGSSLWASFT